jgi:His/Glu/Gln/Arg/opine family amino acid ABC transporter permease subunit
MAAVPSTPDQPHLKASASRIPAFLRDERVLQVLGQIIFAIVIAVFISQLVSSIFTSLASKNLSPTFSFLTNRAGFDISNAPGWYSSNSNYWTAFQVGLMNTFRVVSVGLVLTTLMGVTAGVFLLSSNWLIRTITRTYVEAVRNTPLLAQLFVWYFIVMLSLPTINQAFTLPVEGIVPLPLRLIIYVVIWFIAWLQLRKFAPTAPRRVVITTGLLALFVTIEIAFWLNNTQAAWSGSYGNGNLVNGGFLLYTAVSLLLIGAAWYAPKQMRWQALGVTVGQLIGGLLFYFGIVPNGEATRLEIYPAVFISVRGFVFPEILITSRFALWMAFVGVGLALAVMMWVFFGRVIETTGKPIPRGLYALLAIVGFAVIGWGLVGTTPVPATVPVVQEGVTTYVPIEEARAAGLLTEADEQLYSQQPLLFFLPRQTTNKGGLVTGYATGTEIQPEYMALLLGLVVYTSSFIAEIVRAGIIAVPRGQIEAARALGFSTTQTLRMIILPQALRVIIPPLGNQYLNLSKNSSLAVVIAYADVVFVTTTIMNQSGQSVTGISMLMAVYLAISLSISLFTNWFNRRFKLVTR